jgi:hypothetical protein
VGLLDLARTIRALTEGGFLTELGLDIPPQVIALANGVWALLLLACAIGLWRLRPWARRATGVAVPLHELTFLVMQAVFARSESAQRGWPIMLLWSGATILITWVLLSLPSPRRQNAPSPCGDLRHTPERMSHDRPHEHQPRPY